ncbi:MAG: hypothetical protein HY740_02710 [Chloroflexi bacterium]|nr:hypothetical protein [Chloroflexota bacterium]
MIAVTLWGNSSAIIPPEGLVGADAKSARMVTTRALSQWANVDDGTLLRIFEVKLPDGRLERRAFIQTTDVPSSPDVYLGPLTHQLGDTPAQTILFEVGGSRFIFGCVDDTVRGTLAFFNAQRVEPNKAKWMRATKIGEIEEARCFIFPIFASEIKEWTAVSEVRITTRESLSTEAASLTLTGSQWEKTFDPPIDISSLFIHITLP